MKIIKTSKGNTYEVEYASAALFDGSCRILIHDQRPISVIADEFEGLSSILYTDSDVGVYHFDDYSNLIAVSRLNDGPNTEIVLIKGATEV